LAVWYKGGAAATVDEPVKGAPLVMPIQDMLLVKSGKSKPVVDGLEYGVESEDAELS